MVEHLAVGRALVHDLPECAPVALRRCLRRASSRRPSSLGPPSRVRVRLRLRVRVRVRVRVRGRVRVSIWRATCACGGMWGAMSRRACGSSTSSSASPTLGG